MLNLFHAASAEPCRDARLRRSAWQRPPALNEKWMLKRVQHDEEVGKRIRHHRN
jgi:hypothetical protein